MASHEHADFIVADDVVDICGRAIVVSAYSGRLQSFDLNAPDLSRQCRPGPLPELDLVLDPRFAGAEGMESPATQLQAGELASLNYAGGSSRPAPQVVLVWVQAAALSTPAQAVALGWARADA
jgi:hypothetical protein